MITVEHKGDFKKLDNWFEKLKGVAKLSKLDEFGRKGVEALSANTPKYTGLASTSWFYEIERSDGLVKLTWCNSDIENGYNVAVLVLYGHATKSGSWVEGVDYINPALEPIFNDIAELLLKEVSRLVRL